MKEVILSILRTLPSPNRTMGPALTVCTLTKSSQHPYEHDGPLHRQMGTEVWIIRATRDRSSHEVYWIHVLTARYLASMTSNWDSEHMGQK